MASPWIPVPEAHGAWTPVNEPVDLRPKNVGTQPDTPVAQQGMFESVWSAVKNIADPIHDAVKSGDLGAHAADEFFRGLLNKAKSVASGEEPLHQGILDASGAQAAGDRMQQQYDAGNYSGMAGSALGFVLPFFAPKAAGAAKDAIAAAPDALDSINATKGAQVAKLVAKHVTKKFTGPINLANDISEVVTGEPIGVLPRRTAAAKVVPISAPAAEMSAEDLARQRNILETRRLDQTAIRNQVASGLPEGALAPIDAPPQSGSLPSGRNPGPAPAPEAIPARPQRIPLWQQIKALEEQSAPVDAAPPASISLPSGRIPGNSPAYEAQWQPTAHAPAPAPAPVAPVAPPVAAPQPAAFPSRSIAEWMQGRNGVAGPYDTGNVNELVPDTPRTPRLSLAEQLRDEMIRNGNATEEHLLPHDPAGVHAGLRDMMRDQPPGAPKAIADANYAGDQNPEVAGAVYEAAARADKATKLADALHKGGIPYKDALTMDPDHWEMVSKALGVKSPSKASIGETLFRLQRLEFAATKATGGTQ